MYVTTSAQSKRNVCTHPEPVCQESAICYNQTFASKSKKYSSQKDHRPALQRYSQGHKHLSDSNQHRKY
jgi:hypothetical protein